MLGAQALILQTIFTSAKLCSCVRASERETWSVYRKWKRGLGFVIPFFVELGLRIELMHINQKREKWCAERNKGRIFEF